MTPCIRSALPSRQEPRHQPHRLPGGFGLSELFRGFRGLLASLFDGFQPVAETVGSMAGFLGLLVGLFRAGRGSFLRALGGFQAIPQALTPAPLASKRLLRVLGSTVRLCESGRRHGRQPLVVGPEGAALGGDGLFGAICPAVRLSESGFDYSHEPVMLCSKTGALGDSGLFGPICPCLRSAAIRLRLIGPSALGIRTRFRHPPVGLCRVGSCLGPVSPASFCVGAGLRCGCPLSQ